MLLKVAAVGGAASLLPIAVSPIPDANMALNLVMVVVLLFGAPRFFRASRAEAAMQEKDRTIETYEQSVTADRTRMEGLERDLTKIRERRDELEERNSKLSEVAAGFQARYEEQSRYTAKEALETLTRLLEHQEGESERRHTEMLELLSSVRHRGDAPAD